MPTPSITLRAALPARAKSLTSWRPPALGSVLAESRPDAGDVVHASEHASPEIPVNDAPRVQIVDRRYTVVTRSGERRQFCSQAAAFESTHREDAEMRVDGAVVAQWVVTCVTPGGAKVVGHWIWLPRG